MRPLLTVPAAAEQLGMKVSTLRKWVSNRRVNVVKFGRSHKAAVRIEPAEIERLVALHRRPAVVLSRAPTAMVIGNRLIRTGGPDAAHLRRVR